MATLESQFMAVRTQTKIGNTKTLVVLREAIGRVRLHHVYGVCYVIIALMCVATEKIGVLGWFHSLTGITADIPAVMFALCGLIFLYKPNKPGVILCLTPLIIYGIIATLFVIDNDRFSLTTTWFIISTLLFMWVLYFKKIGPFDARHIFSASSMILGITILLNPDRGTAAWLHDLWLRFPAEAFGLLLIFAACYMAIVKTREGFNKGIYALDVYAVASLMFSTTAAGGMAGSVTLLTFACITWVIFKASDYLPEAQ